MNKVKLFAAVIALAVVAASTAARADLITVDFTVNPLLIPPSGDDPGSSWFSPDTPPGTPYGVGPNTTLAGSVVLDNSKIDGTTFQSLNYVTGSRTWTLADIDIADSGATFNGDGSFNDFSLIFNDPINDIFSNNTVSLFNSLVLGQAPGPGFGFIACNGCVTAEQVDRAAGGGGSVPEPAAWALMIVGFGGVGAALRRRRMASPIAA
jgi:hypothetical protein